MMMEVGPMAKGMGRISAWVPRQSVVLLLLGPTFIGPFATLVSQFDSLYWHTCSLFHVPNGFAY